MAKVSPKKKSNTAFLAVIAVVLIAGGVGIWTAMQRAKPKPIELAEGTPLPEAEGYLRGDPKAPITIIEFADFECPGCGQFAALQEPDIMARIVEAGLANFRFYDFPLTNIHQNTLSAHLAAACANEQGKFWAMHDAIFAGQGEWSGVVTGNPRPLLDGYAQKVGLDMAKYGECFDAQRPMAQIRANMKAGQERGVNSTPTLVVGNKVYPGGLTYDQLKAVVDSIRATLPAASAAAPTDSAQKP